LGEYVVGRIVSGKRFPIAAGLFYEAERERLLAQMDWGFRHRLGPGRLPGETGPGAAEALVMPHGGYFAAGPVYAHAVLAAAEGWDTVVVVGPNHTGVGADVAVYPGGGYWSTPLGDVEVDAEASRGVAEAAGAELDVRPHLYEHSVEVVLPWLQRLRGTGWRLVAVSLYDASPETASALAEAVAGLLEAGRRVLVVASANLSSYLGWEEARRKDRVLLDAVLGLEPGAVYRVVVGEEIPTCSAGVLEFFVAYTRLRGLRPRLLAYTTSGDVVGEKGVVTGYAAIAAEPAAAEGGGAE
jgi:AmmeMemoRadiSam system protein B